MKICQSIQNRALKSGVFYRYTSTHDSLPGAPPPALFHMPSRPPPTSHQFMPHHHRPHCLMPSDRESALLDEVYANPYSYELLRRPPPPSYEVTMRSSSRPPPSYEMSMRSGSRPCPSATSTSAASSSEERPHHHVHRHHRHHHGPVIKHKVTVRSATATASSSSASAAASPQPSTSGSRREDRKRSNPETSEASASKKTSQDVKEEERQSSPQPGPSGMQQSSAAGGSGSSTSQGLNAPDLQLDCLSSDSDDDGTEEDVTVVKISRRRKGTSKKKWHNSTTTINAPPGSIVEVDLTQESDHPDEEDDDIRVDSIRPRNEARGDGLINVRGFATVPHLPPNVQSRGSTPSTTPAPGTSSDMFVDGAAPYVEPHSHPCNGECGMFHCPPPPPDYRPRRLRQPYHHQVGCQDAHCRNHHRAAASTSTSMSGGGASASMATPSTSSDRSDQQPLDCRSTANTASTEGNSEPPTNQRLINAVWRMQHHHSMRASRMHPRHQRLWHSCQYQQELMRRHMGSTSSGMNTTPAHHAPTEYPNPMYPHAPMPAHMGAYPINTNFYNYMPQRTRFHPSFPHTPEAPHAAAGLYANTPFLLQPVVTLRGFSDEYRRLMDQRHAVENSRGASKGCIERNTFPHKFKHIPREKSDKNDENDEGVDKCTICLCGKKIPVFDKKRFNINLILIFFSRIRRGRRCSTIALYAFIPCALR